MNVLKMTVTPLLAALILAGCSSTPVLKAPMVPVPAAFKEAAQQAVAADGSVWKVAQPAESQARGEWWLAFHDPVLNDLIGQATEANADASSATYRSVLLSLQADVAQTYYRIRSTDAELGTLAKATDLRAQSVKVNQSRFDNGDIGEFDLVRAKTELAAARAEEIGLQRQRATLEHALAVLLGKPAAAFSAGANPLLDVAALPVIPAGLPSALLERRPDVTAAQRAMVASNARIGVARAAMFPALGLSAAGGGESVALSNILKMSGHSWLLGALLSMPVIDGGRNKANIARSEAVLEESVAAYRQNVLVAFAE